MSNTGERNIRPRVLYVGSLDQPPESLEASGLDVDVVLSAESALKKLESDFYDCIVSEPNLPGMNGTDLWRDVKDSLSDSTSFILVSDSDGSDEPEIEDSELPFVDVDELTKVVWVEASRTVEGFDDRRENRGSSDGDGVSVNDVSEELKEAAMNKAPVGIIITDFRMEDNPIVYANRSFRRLTGYSENEVLGENCRFLQGEDSSLEPVKEMREAVEEGRPTAIEILNYRKNGETFWNRVDIAPIYGDEGEVEYFVGFQMDASRMKRAEKEAEERASDLRREKRNLNELVSRLEKVLRGISRVFVEAGTESELEESLCRVLAETPPYSYAWIGEPDVAGRRIEPRRRVDSGEEPSVEYGDDADMSDPVVRALETSQIQVTSVSGELHGLSGYRSVAAVPLMYKKESYGVLVLYSESLDPFDETEKKMLGSVGRMIAGVINAYRNKRGLPEGGRVELELSIDGKDVFYSGLSRELDCRMEFKEVANESGKMYFVVKDADYSDIKNWIQSRNDVRSVSRVGEETENIHLEFDCGRKPVVDTVREHGGEVESLEVASGDITVKIHVDGEKRAKSLTEVLESTYRKVDLNSYRRMSEDGEDVSPQTISRDIDLTDKQLEALRKAYLAGYFEWPREATGEEIADSIGISKTTFHQHVRKAEKKILDVMFE